MKNTRQIDMVQGPIFRKLIFFSIPVILSGILQLLFNAADVIVVGRFSGSEALAAVGSTSSLINLLINLFLGISIGANVLVGQYIGARDIENCQKTVHTGILFALFGGLAMGIFGFLMAPVLLTWMATPPNVLPLSTTYMQIYFIGLPALLVYDFGAALLRAIGDTKRPLYFLLISGIINVCLNLFFVLGFNMGVAGVAIATIISEFISALLVLICLHNTEGPIQFQKKNLHFSLEKGIKMVKIGVPAGVQGMLFSISNVLIQSSVNGFGSTVMAGNTASLNIENFVYISMNAIYQTALSFTSQNMGAKQYKRIDKILFECLCLVVIVGLVLGWGAYLGGDWLLHIYSGEPEVIKIGLIRLSIICTTYFTCGIMDVLVGSLRGMGYSILPMFVSMMGVCAFRVLWIFTIFQMHKELFVLYISYPISWILTIAVDVVCYVMIRKHLARKNG
ncbi:MATE family efflux transporter [uncultured Faecalicoccus sp.]|uniref:MATE family efflux transporter n=1 Tax=uncultured Faecalicoccus sp. TaxID=1971760 RepID=UPI0026131884|nr:MATE family efflux transporter [uncultured Faecalicoccus sp.]